MSDYLLPTLTLLLAFWLCQALVLSVWGGFNGSRWLPSLLAGLLLGPLVGGLLVWWRGRLHRWRQSWKTFTGPGLFIEDGDGLYCRFCSRQVDGGWAARRTVYWQLPAGEPPVRGWPIVLLFHGTAHPAQLYFGNRHGAAFGGIHQVRASIDLLEAGFAVVAPDALGRIGWMTNLWPFSRFWNCLGNPDRRFLRALLRDLQHGDFGHLDGGRLFAAGISSGGYMSSRMAVSYPGRFKALGVAAAAYASCLGRYGKMPASLPSDHPPTLFIHGRRDPLAPFSRMQEYRQRLQDAGVETALLEDAETGHAWLPGSGAALTEWFSRHQ